MSFSFRVKTKMTRVDSDPGLSEAVLPAGVTFALGINAQGWKKPKEQKFF